MPAILYPLPKIVKKFNTIGFSGGTESLEADVIVKIRHCANKGLILGTEKFRKQFEDLTGDETL